MSFGRPCGSSGCTSSTGGRGARGEHGDTERLRLNDDRAGGSSSSIARGSYSGEELRVSVDRQADVNPHVMRVVACKRSLLPVPVQAWEEVKGKARSVQISYPVLSCQFNGRS